MRNRPSAPELFLDGLTSAEPELPPHAGLGALERRLTDWVDRGLERRSSAPWLLSLRLDERDTSERRARQRVHRRARAVAAGGRRSDAGPPHLAPLRRRRRGVRLPPLGRPADRRAPPARADRARPRRGRARASTRSSRPRSSSSDDDVRFVLPHRDPAAGGDRRARAAAAQLGQLGQQAARQPHRDEHDAARSSGLLTTDALARFDWKLAIGDTTLTEEELAELAAAKEPLIRDPGPLARAAPLRGREGPAVPRAPARGLGRRPRPRGLGHRARGRGARARRGHARRRARRAARRAATSGASSPSAPRRR